MSPSSCVPAAFASSPGIGPGIEARLQRARDDRRAGGAARARGARRCPSSSASAGCSGSRRSGCGSSAAALGVRTVAGLREAADDGTADAGAGHRAEDGRADPRRPGGGGDGTAAPRDAPQPRPRARRRDRGGARRRARRRSAPRLRPLDAVRGRRPRGRGARRFERLPQIVSVLERSADRSVGVTAEGYPIEVRSPRPSASGRRSCGRPGRPAYVAGPRTPARKRPQRWRCTPTSV